VSTRLIEVLRQHKAELLAWLSRLPCPGWQAVPPSDLRLLSIMPRPTTPNRERVIGYLLRQIGGKPCALAEWIERREQSYYDGPGRHWNCGTLAYCAAIDCACWQLNRSEGDIWELLAGFDQ
jgi:hypothetical protein